MSAKEGLRQKKQRSLYAIAFSRLLTELRVRRKLTQKQVAKRAKIKPLRLVRYERGIQIPVIGDLLLFGEVFRVDPVWLLDETIRYRDQLAKNGSV